LCIGYHREPGGEAKSLALARDILHDLHPAGYKSGVRARRLRNIDHRIQMPFEVCKSAQ
jgi:hypothetical protein